MDVLSDVVSTARTGRPHAALVTRSAPFGRWFPASQAAGFHVVLQGTCWLLQTEAEPVAAAFARRFTQLVGRPPLTYLTWWRLTTAARLLRTCDAPVNTIAQQVGYTSPYAFTHAFKRQYGMPPGAYRSGAC
ncbi:AraC family transcriptional regulator [Microbispora bryophytorum]|uniref:AraC family transcriptional regulator n=1 Tax=Microbispora bryophytorum TaxID=1460882 RepID=UPI003409426C